MKFAPTKIFIFCCVLFTGITAQSQDSNKKYNRLSIDARGGLGFIFGTGDKSVKKWDPGVDRNIDKGKYTGINQFDLGLRYMFNQRYGLRGQVAYNRFRGPDLPGVRITRLGIEAVVNLSYLSACRESLYTSFDHFRVLLHAGFGATLTQSLIHTRPYGNSNVDYGYNLMIGITPIYKLSERFALQADFTFNYLLQRNYDFDGTFFDPPSVGQTSGSIGTFSVGIIYYIGNYKYHADWY